MSISKPKFLSPKDTIEILQKVNEKYPLLLQKAESNKNEEEIRVQIEEFDLAVHAAARCLQDIQNTYDYNKLHKSK